MIAAVVGSSGLLGRALCHRLLAGGHTVYGYCRTGSPPLGTLNVHLDLANDTIVFPPKVEAVYYLAQSPHYRSSGDHAAHLHRINCQGAVGAAESARRAGATFFFYASTGSVYDPSFAPLAETNPVHAATPYLASKLAAEDALCAFERDMRLVRGRLFGILGPSPKGRLPANIFRAVRAGVPVILQPSPAADDVDGLRISYLASDDAARILEALVDVTCSRSLPVLNVGGPEPISLRRLAETMGVYFRCKPVFERGDAPRAGDLVADIRLLRQAFPVTFTPIDQVLESLCQSLANEAGA